MKQRLTLAGGFASLLLLITACSGPSASGPGATAQALAESINQTATASSLDEVSSEESLLIAQAAATAEREAIAVTQTARAQASEDEAALTATAAAPIMAELPTYGVDPAAGELAWIHPPVEISIEGYLQSDFVNQFLATVARDFVLSSDITWNNDTSASGCGFVLRSDGNQEAANQYAMFITQANAGSMSFIRQTGGEPFVVRAFSFSGIDPAFGWRNNETNRMTVVGRGDTFSLYTNGTFIEEVSASEFDQGFVAMVAVGESGQTRCQFDNSWLWIIHS